MIRKILFLLKVFWHFSIFILYYCWQNFFVLDQWILYLISRRVVLYVEWNVLLNLIQNIQVVGIRSKVCYAEKENNLSKMFLFK